VPDQFRDRPPERSAARLRRVPESASGQPAGARATSPGQGDRRRGAGATGSRGRRRRGRAMITSRPSQLSGPRRGQPGTAQACRRAATQNAPRHRGRSHEVFTVHPARSQTRRGSWRPRRKPDAVLSTAAATSRFPHIPDADTAWGRDRASVSPHSTRLTSARRSAGRRSAPPSTPWRSPAAPSPHERSGKVRQDRLRHADCVHRLRYTHSPSQPAVLLQPYAWVRNGRLRPRAGPAFLPGGAIGRLCRTADRAPAAPDVVAVDAVRRDWYRHHGLPPSALRVDHRLSAGVTPTPVPAVAGGGAVL